MEESCTHPIQLGGMCAVCGKDLTATDYAGYADSSRASIAMSHHHAALTVSQAEAERIERESADRLRADQKLSLIVDLDQTIVHATVDPTVGEWMKDTRNPNYTALQDVCKFKLANDGTPARDDEEGCFYYIKHRPGLREFLSQVANKYEMHVYTMGTRHYAESVCRGIDPDGTFFGDRILSRDESGSMTQKSLTRLFPVNTNMVVIIDDRADVWEWSPHLLKVVPYEFFVGIGDINGAFLPKKSGVLDGNAKAKRAVDENGPASPPFESIVPPQQDSEELEAAQEAANVEIAHQLSDRPLLREAARAQQKVEDGSDEKQDAAATSDMAEAPIAVLKDDDHELERLAKLLDTVHERFYSKATSNPDTFNKRLKQEPDVKDIIVNMKKHILAGVQIVFSGVIPLGVNPARSEIWRLAESFGAVCSNDIGSTTTHLVIGRDRTAKMDEALRRGNIQVVWTAWLLESMALWRRMKESDYAVTTAAPSSKRSAPLNATQDAVEDQGVISQDADADEGQDEEEGPELDLENMFDNDGLGWADADDELDAFLMEAEDEQPSVLSKKRSRSSTPLISGEADDMPLTPLGKRQRLAANRVSKLKTSTSAADVDSADEDSDDGFLDAFEAGLG